jgi:biotin transport system substrate-specific component
VSLTHPLPESAATPADASLRPFLETLQGKAALAFAASLFVAAAAHVSIPLPFTPVPLTLGNMAVILVGLFLSPSLAFAALIAYLAEGAAGAPVFNPGGLGGVHQLVGPTGGFLFAYPLAAVAASAAVRFFSRIASRFAAATLAATLGTALVMFFGVVWLGFLLHLTPGIAFKLGVAPFLPGEIVKILAAAGIFASLQRWHKA